jgi:chaperone required for assembly of F1-ATPase
MTGRRDNGSKSKGMDVAAAARTRPTLPRRFYKSVMVAGRESPPTFRILLDGKPARTPAKAELAVPTHALGEAIAAEWSAQGDHIDAATMPQTRLANTAIDGVTSQLAQVRADITAFAASDLVCYRADGPEPLVEQQCQRWDPVLAWARDALGARFAVATGLMPVGQPEDAIAAVAVALENLDHFHLTALHVMTTLTGSALLALAHARGALAAEAAWAAAHVDEDWQISRWGEDAEAAARRAHRWAEMQAASRLLALLG